LALHRRQLVGTLLQPGQQQAESGAADPLPGSQKVTVGQRKLIQNAGGGSGNGRIQYKRSVSPGHQCRLLPLGKKVRVFVRGEPGVCKITATKVRSRKYNEVQPAPVTLTVTR
jgi:hypothetical protein